MQKHLITILITGTLLCQPAAADSYSTEATISLEKDKGTLNVDVRVARLSQLDGKLAEQVVEEPRIRTAPGVPATLHSGPQPGDSNYASRENITVEVSWPYPNESGIAFCAVTVQLGNQIVSKSRMQLNIEGPGRMPLLIAARDVDPKSVRVVQEHSQFCVLLELVGRTQEEVKKLALENYGNKVRILDANGDLTEGGVSFGTYPETGLALHFDSKNEAERVASLLRAAAPNEAR